MSFRFDITRREGIHIIALEGDLLDPHNAAALLEEAQRLAGEEQAHRFVIDMAGVRNLNSTGLGVLVNLLTKSRKHGGETVLANLTGQVKNLYLITKLDSIFAIAGSTDEAVNMLLGEAEKT